MESELKEINEEDRQERASKEKQNGNALYKTGQLEQAIEAYTRGLQYTPRNALLLSNRAQAYLRLQKYKECEADCTASISSDPYFAKSYMRRAAARIHLENLKEAYKDLKKTLKLDSDKNKTRHEIATMLMNKGNHLYKQSAFQEAIDVYNEGLRYENSHVVLRLQKAKTLYKLQSYTECEEECSILLEQKPPSTEAYLRRGKARLYLCNSYDAIQDIKSFLNLSKNKVETKKDLHELLLKMSRKNKADSLNKKNTDKKSNQIEQRIKGEHECQESEGGEESEDNLKKLFATCKKNPDHPDFIPIKKFSLKDLPELYQDKDLFELIKSKADITVRVCVERVSPGRPEFWPNTKDEYPFYAKGGNKTVRTGTGFIGAVKYESGCGCDQSGNRYELLTGKSLDVDYKTCPCDNCRQSETPSDNWWWVRMHTATHVVFDDIEASYTSCRLFYDEKNSPKVILDKWSKLYANVERDKCILQCFICDKTLGEKIYEMVCRSDELWDKIWKWYRNIPNHFSFIISHPHGCSKMVTLGEWEEKRVAKVSETLDNHYLSTFIYTTSTCPGSSGASVFFLGLAAGHVHNGAVPECNGKQFNYSSVDFLRITSSTTIKETIIAAMNALEKFPA